MSYSVEFTPQSIKQLEKIAPTIQSRIIKKLRWLETNIKKITPQSLKGNLSDFYKLRVGDYRVIYTLNTEEKIITVHEIGHRREIYE